MQAPVGSAAEAEIELHLTEQEAQMATQTATVQQELVDCQTKS